MSGTTVAWPFGCPASWNETSRTSTLRSEVENGQPKSRRRFTRGYREARVGWVFRTWAEYQAVTNFLQTELGDCSLGFSMRHPLSGETIIWRFKAYPTLSASADSNPAFSVEAEMEELFA